MAGLTNAGKRDWTARPVAALRQEATRSADTHLLHASFHGLPDIDFYFKDEAARPAGSLEHRLACSLFLYTLCNGCRPGQAVVDASSGSVAISEAWFARLLGLSFIAVMPATRPGMACARRPRPNAVAAAPASDRRGGDSAGTPGAEALA